MCLGSSLIHKIFPMWEFNFIVSEYVIPELSACFELDVKGFEASQGLLWFIVVNLAQITPASSKSSYIWMVKKMTCYIVCCADRNGIICLKKGKKYPDIAG